MTRPWLAKLVLAVLVPVLALVAAEAVLRGMSYGVDPSWTVSEAGGGWRDNPDIGRLWFPPGQTRSPVPFRVAATSGAVRVVVLGESAAMGDPVPAFGLPRQLEVLLRGRFPKVRFEVINAAMTAIDSSVIVDIARDIGRLDPDIVVVYMGNNEVVGPFGPSPDHRFLPSLDARYARAVLAARATRTGQLLRNGWYGAISPEAGWRGLMQFTERVVPPESPVLGAIHRRYRDNLERIVASIRRTGAEPVLATLASRPFWAPFGPADVPGGAEAIAAHREALALRVRGETAEAVRLSMASRDLDPLRFRADAVINEAVRSWRGKEQVVDVEAVVLASPEDPAALFWDHVHFTPEGTYVAARAISDAIGHQLEVRGVVPGGAWPERDEVLRALHDTPWDRLNTISVMYHRLVRAPFSGRIDHRQVVADITTRFRAARKGIGQRDVEAVRDALIARVSSPVIDPFDGTRLVRALEELEQADVARAVAERLVRDWPHVRAHRHLQGRLLVASGDAAQGLPLLEQGEVPGGARPRALARIEAAAGLAEQGRVSEALVLLDGVIDRHPGLAKAWYNRAVIYGRLGQLDRAQRDFLEAFAREPDMVEALNNLGVIALKLNRTDDAERHFRQALAHHPYHVGALRNLAMVLAARGDRAGAASVAATLAVCDPDWDGPAGH